MTFNSKKPSLTQEQEADEIVRRLSTPPKTLSEIVEEELMASIADEIAREMDKAIYETLVNPKLAGFKIIKEEIDASITSRIRRDWEKRVPSRATKTGISD